MSAAPKNSKIKGRRVGFALRIPSVGDRADSRQPSVLRKATTVYCWFEGNRSAEILTVSAKKQHERHGPRKFNLRISQAIAGTECIRLQSGE